jgi:hypothetical protein
MRYFYHYGEHRTHSSKVELNPRNFATSNALIETTKENYNLIVEEEKRIMGNYPDIKGWHFPIACEEIPEGKFIYFRRKFEWSSIEK